MMIHRVFHNRQPQTAAAGLPRARFIHAIETLGQTRNMLRRNARPVIFDAKLAPVGACCQRTVMSVPGVWFTAL
jgi:hypothetical protein